MYLLDTNICIALLKADPQVVKKFNLYFSQCYLSIIVVAELYKGVYYSQKLAKNLKKIQQFLDLLLIEPFDINAACEFGKIQSELKKIGKPTGEVMRCATYFCNPSPNLSPKRREALSLAPLPS